MDGADPRLRRRSDRPRQRSAKRALRSYLFAGSDRGASLNSLIETAKLNDLDPEAYLHDMLGHIADHPASKLNDLLPWRWKSLEAAAKAA